MRGLALVVALASLTAAAQSTPRFKRFTQRTDQGRNSRGLLANSLAFFEAFNGAGLTTACSATAPTGAKGEALTFTRTGSATCTKTATGGLATTGIADGDLVALSGNVARVEYDSAGTLGLLVESSRTNSLLRSEEISNAAWTKLGTVIAAPTVTADFATSPGGTTTAERVQLAASSGASQTSLIRQTVTTTGGAAYVCTVYVRGNGTSGTTYINNSLAAGGSTPGACAYVSGSWTRCSFAFNAGGVADGCDLGTNTFLNIATTQPTHDLLVWGFQLEAGSYATSYLPTTTASAVRNAETATFALSSPSASQSIAATRNGPTGGSGARVFALTQTSGSAAYGIGIYGSSGTGTALLGNTPNTLAAGTLAVATRAWASWDGTTFTVNFDGTSNTSTPGASITVRNALAVGIDTAGGGSGWADGIVSRVCLDPSPTRCR